MTDIQSIKHRIGILAGDKRVESFDLAVSKFSEYPGNIVETGCFRGIPEDGNSTLIFAIVARAFGVRLFSIELSERHVELAKTLLVENNLADTTTFIEGDSVIELGGLTTTIGLLYLDSSPNYGDRTVCQRHNLAEMGAAYHKLNRHCVVLLDDNREGEGVIDVKPKHTALFLKERGWEEIYRGYQLVYHR